MSLDKETLQFLSEMRNDISKMRDDIKNDVRENNQLMLQGVHARIDDKHDMVMKEFDSVKKRQDITNGRVNKLEHSTGLISWAGRNKIASVILVIIFAFLINWLADHVNISKTIKNKTGIELNTN